MGTVAIKWEHGDADFTNEESYDVKDIDNFLQFLVEVMGTHEVEYKGVKKVVFTDDHYKRKAEHFNKVVDKYPQYQDIIPMDVWYKSYDYRPAIENISIVKNGNCKALVVENHLNTIILPDINSTYTFDSWRIPGGFHCKGLNIEYKNHFKPRKKRIILSGKVESIMYEPIEYNWVITNFNYIIFIRLPDGTLTCERVYGFDKTIPFLNPVTLEHDNSKLYFFKYEDN